MGREVLVDPADRAVPVDSAVRLKEDPGRVGPAKVVLVDLPKEDLGRVASVGRASVALVVPGDPGEEV